MPSFIRQPVEIIVLEARNTTFAISCADEIIGSVTGRLRDSRQDGIIGDLQFQCDRSRCNV